MSLASNFTERLALLRTALTRRYIWHDLTARVKAHGYVLGEIRANTQPLRFARQVLGPAPFAAPPDFAARLGSIDGFALAKTYEWNSEPSVSEFLGELAFHQRAQTIVELGCYVGWTSAHFALAQQAGAGGRLWCLDFDPRFLEAARANLARLGLAGRTEFIQGMSLDPAVLAALPASIDLLYIDTSHEYQPTLDEIAAYASRLAPGGFIALHDSISQDGVRRAVHERWADFETLTFATEFGNGVTVLRPLTSATAR